MRRPMYRYIIKATVYKDNIPTHDINNNYKTNKRISCFQDVERHMEKTYKNIDGIIIIDNLIRVV